MVNKTELQRLREREAELIGLLQRVNEVLESRTLTPGIRKLASKTSLAIQDELIEVAKKMDYEKDLTNAEING